MSERKIYMAFWTAFLVLVAVLLVGCQSKEKFPIYQMETQENYLQILYIDDVQYKRNLSSDWDKQAHYYGDGARYVWTPIKGVGEQIGVCSEAADKDGEFAIYEIAGDKEHIFLYTAPKKFYFGGVTTHLWMQADVTLESPTVETVSSIAIIPEKKESDLIQVDEPSMIAALLNAYNGDSIQTPENLKKGEDWVDASLIMYHKNFSFLQYEIGCCYSLEQEAFYGQKESGEWFVLPSEWSEVLSK